MRVAVLGQQATCDTPGDSTKTKQLPRECLEVLTSIPWVSPGLHHHQSIDNYIHEGTSQVHEEAEDSDGDRALKVHHRDHPRGREL